MSGVEIAEGPTGLKAVGGATDEHGHVVLFYEDGSTVTLQNVVMFTGTLTDNGDDTVTITPADEED